MLRFIMGAVAGSLAVWFWGEELKRYANEGGRTLRSKAAETLESVDHTAGGKRTTIVSRCCSTNCTLV